MTRMNLLFDSQDTLRLHDHCCILQIALKVFEDLSHHLSKLAFTFFVKYIILCK